MLAFDEDNRKTMTADEDVMKLLIHFNKSANSALKNASYGALWTMRHILKDSEKYKELGITVFYELSELKKKCLLNLEFHVFSNFFNFPFVLKLQVMHIVAYISCENLV